MIDPSTSLSIEGDAVLKNDWANARNILVMRLDNMGDVIMTSPALQAIKATLPSARLTLLASPAGVQAAPMLPWVDEVITWRALWQDLGRLGFDPDREWQLIMTLRQRHFDAVEDNSGVQMAWIK